MRRLKARFGGHVLAFATFIGIAMDWTQALGQGTPDELDLNGAVQVPEPATLSLFAVGVAATIAAKWYRNRR